MPSPGVYRRPWVRKPVRRRAVVGTKAAAGGSFQAAWAAGTYTTGDAPLYLKKNTASQTIGFRLVNASTGAALTGATVSVRRCLDGTFAAGGGTVTEDSGGLYKFAPSQADTNADQVTYYFTATSAIPECLNLRTTAADPSDTVRFGLTALPNATAGANTGLPVVGTQVPNATAGASGGLFIAGTNAATTVTTSFTTTFTGNLTGSVGSVTGAVGSVTGAVGSVTGNVGGNVTGSVGSVVGAVGSVTGAVGSISGVTFPTNFGTLGINASGHVSRVTLADTITTYTGNTVQTGDSFARIGATGSGLTSLAPSATALSTATWTGTRAGYLDNLSGGAVALASGVNVTQVGGSATPVTNITTVFSTDFASNYNTSLDGWKVVLNTDQDVGGGVYASDSVGEVLQTLGTLTDAGGIVVTPGSVRTAVGLASANLDTQLTAKPTLAQILAGGDIDGYTLEEAQKLQLAALAGKLSGAATSTVTIRSADDTANRVVATVDSNGNRSAVTLNAAG